MIYLLISAFIFAGDCVIKHYIETHKKLGSQEKKLKEQVIITNYRNQGAFLNLFEKKREMLLVLSGVMIGVLGVLMVLFYPKKGSKLLKLGISFVTGGAASNVYDRIKHGYVVDYITFTKFDKIIYNISDFFIFAGCIIMTVRLMMSE